MVRGHPLYKSLFKETFENYIGLKVVEEQIDSCIFDDQKSTESE